jgi:leader peptidase (prepilin peptidase)/N-methyltransferase
MTTSITADAIPASAAGVPGRPAGIAGAEAEPRRVHPVPRHPLLGLAVAGTTVLSFAMLGLHPRTFLVAFTAGVLAVLGAIDIAHRVLPNRIVLPATAVVLAAQTGLAPDRAPEWLLAGLAAAAFLGLPLLIRRDAMGMGDIKLALLLGAATGWAVFGAIVIGCLAMIPVAVLMIARNGSIRGATVPFGPFLALGAILVMLAGGA